MTTNRRSSANANVASAKKSNGKVATVDEVIDLAHGHHQAGSHAALPGAAGERRHHALLGDLRIGVVHLVPVRMAERGDLPEDDDEDGDDGEDGPVVERHLKLKA